MKGVQLTGHGGIETGQVFPLVANMFFLQQIPEAQKEFETKQHIVIIFCSYNWKVGYRYIK